MYTKFNRELIRLRNAYGATGHEWTRIREADGVRSGEETFAGAAAAKWFGCIRAVAKHASREG